MRDLVNIGGIGEHIYADSDLVVLVLPNAEKKFGSLVLVQGINAPIGTNREPVDVVAALERGS